MCVEETFPLHVAAKASQSTNKELRRQVTNGPLKLQGCDRASSGSGDPIGYSRRRILQAAITKQLTPLGMSASAAARAAFVFTDEGQTRRAPGELFQHGKTILVIAPAGASVRNLFFDVSLSDATDRAIAAIVIDINKVVAFVDSVLNNERPK
jgi:hypothetical protein